MQVPSYLQVSVCLGYCETTQFETAKFLSEQGMFTSITQCIILEIPDTLSQR